MTHNMTHNEIEKKLSSLKGRSILKAHLYPWTLALRFTGGVSNSCADLELKMKWRVLLDGTRVLNEKAWLAGDERYGDQSTDGPEHVASMMSALEGQFVERVTVAKNLRRLRLMLSGGFFVEQWIEKPENGAWAYRDDRGSAHFAVDYRGVENYLLLPPNTLARRHVLFEKDGKQVRGTFILLCPRPGDSDDSKGRVFTDAIIQTPFGEYRLSAAGEDGIESTRRCLMAVQVELDQIADEHHAQVYFVSAELSAVHRHTDGLRIVHGLLQRLKRCANKSACPAEHHPESEQMELLQSCLSRIAELMEC